MSGAASDPGDPVGSRLAPVMPPGACLLGVALQGSRAARSKSGSFRRAFGESLDRFHYAISRDGRQVAQVGDIIREIDGAPITSPAELRAVLDRYRPGDDVTVTILRDGDTLDVVVRLS